MKRFLQLILGFLLVVGLLVGLLLGVGSVIAGKWLSPEYLEAEIERQLACEAKIQSVDHQLFGFGKPARVAVHNLEIRPSKGSLKRLQKDGLELKDSELALLTQLMDNPVIIIEEAVLELNRGALLQRRVDIAKIVLDHPVIRVVDIEGLGSTLQVLAKPKRAPSLPPREPSEAKPDKEKRPTLVNLQQLEIVDGQIEFTKINPDPDPDEDGEPLSVALMNLNVRIDDFSTEGTEALSVPFTLATLLSVDEGADTRFASLDLDGKGELRWKEGETRDFDQASWQVEFSLGKDSYIWIADDIIDDLKEDLQPFTKVADFSNDWDVSRRSHFAKDARIRLGGDERGVVLLEPFRANFDEAWIELDAGSQVTYGADGAETVHEVRGRLRPPAELADGAYGKIQSKLRGLGLGGSWRKVEAAYFKDEELRLPLVSKGPIDDFGFEVRPEPLEVLGLDSLVEQVENLFQSLLSGDDKDKK